MALPVRQGYTNLKQASEFSNYSFNTFDFLQKGTVIWEK
jgi:hypothetical protein